MSVCLSSCIRPSVRLIIRVCSFSEGSKNPNLAGLLISSAFASSGVNLVCYLHGGRGSGSNKFQFFQANFHKILTFQAILKKSISRQKLVIYSCRPTSGQIVLFLPTFVHTS